MGVMPGYKRTEVGVIPEDWDVKLLPEVCRFRAGKAHEQYISDLGEFVCVNSKFISTDGAVRKYATANFCPAKKDDVLLVMSDLPNGRALAKGCLVEEDDVYAVNQRVCALTAYRDCPAYLFYVLNRNPYFLSFDDGVNQTHLLNRVFQKCPVAIPRQIAEQSAIAGALADIDAMLRGLDQLIAKKRDLQQAAIQQLVAGHTRLPGFSDKWEVSRFGDLVARVFPKSTLASGDGLANGAYPLFVSGGEPKRTEVPQFLDSEALVFSDGGVFAVRHARGSFSVTDHCFVVSLRPEVAHMSWYEAWFTLQAQNMDRLTFKGSGLRNLDKASLMNIEVTNPGREEQYAIASVLSDMEGEIVAVEARRDKTRDLKQAMKQELLTGRTRLV
jgi:type I restriction enzyme, S subunit